MKRAYFAIVILVLVCAVAAYIARASNAKVAIRDYAHKVVAECSSEQDRPKCYEREVPQMYPKHSIQEIFAVIREIRREDSNYQFCHVLAHKLGEDVVLEDPSRWINAIPYNPPDGLCSNGFIHGVIIGRFRNDTLSDSQLASAIPDLKRACEPRSDWNPSRLDKAICYHGMGHLFDYITEADMKKSLSLCNKVASGVSGEFNEVCKQGVFMQMYQPLEPDDFALVEHLPMKLTTENYKEFCAEFKDDSIAQGSCLHEAWPLFREGLMNGKSVGTFCSDQPDAHSTTMCYETVSSIIGRLHLQNEDQAVSACKAFPKDGQLICFKATAQAVLEEDRDQFAHAIDICKKAGELSSACMGQLADHAAFVFGDTREKKAFCNALPEEARNACR